MDILVDSGSESWLFPRGTNQFTECRQPEQYHTDRWIVNKVTFYLTFC